MTSLKLTVGKDEGNEFFAINNTHIEEGPSNITPALTKSMNGDIWLVGTSNQLFTKSPVTETNFQ